MVSELHKSWIYVAIAVGASQLGFKMAWCTGCAVKASSILIPVDVYRDFKKRLEVVCAELVNPSNILCLYSIWEGFPV